MYLLHHQFKNDLRLDLSFFHITQCKLHHFFKNILVINDSCLKIQFYKIDTNCQKFGIEISHITSCILHHFSQLFTNVLVLQPCMETKCLVALNMIGLDVVAAMQKMEYALIQLPVKSELQKLLWQISQIFAFRLLNHRHFRPKLVEHELWKLSWQFLF